MIDTTGARYSNMPGVDAGMFTKATITLMYTKYCLWQLNAYIMQPVLHIKQRFMQVYKTQLLFVSQAFYRINGGSFKCL